jgi:hypothetical protein
MRNGLALIAAAFVMFLATSLASDRAQAGSSIAAPQKYGNVIQRATKTSRNVTSRGSEITEFSSSSPMGHPLPRERGRRRALAN